MQKKSEARQDHSDKELGLERFMKKINIEYLKKV